MTAETLDRAEVVAFCRDFFGADDIEYATFGPRDCPPKAVVSKVPGMHDAISEAVKMVGVEGELATSIRFDHEGATVEFQDRDPVLVPFEDAS